MSFLKNIFRIEHKKQEHQDLGNEVPLYLKKGTQIINTQIKIKNNNTPQSKNESSLELTTEQILSDNSLPIFISSLYPNSNISNFSLTIYDENNDSHTYIKLKANSKPYSLLNKTDKKLYLVQNHKKTKPQNTNISSTFFTIEHKLQKKKKNKQTKKDKLFTGEVFTLNDNLKGFNKQQMELTDEKVIISPNNNSKIINVSDINDISFDIKTVPSNIADMIKDKKHIINITLHNNDNVIMYYPKKQSEYDKLKNHFEYILRKYKQKQKDVQLTTTISNINQSISHTLEQVHNYLLDKCLNNQNIVIVSKSNNIIQNDNPFHTDVIEDIVSYRKLVSEKDYFQAWCTLKKLESHSRMNNENEQMKNISTMNNEIRDKHVRLSQQIEDIIFNMKGENDLFGNIEAHIGYLLPFDLLDEIYFIIKTNILKDMFNKIANCGIVIEKEDEGEENDKKKKEELYKRLRYMDVYFFLSVNFYNLKLVNDVKINVIESSSNVI